ncbi:uncharacterized protein [Ranitomeya imitator]|uniref:uncharacterized protein n=1 Tax=Ranitomeya imitator TaxID=111125 RepID=UPI0037E7C8BF
MSSGIFSFNATETAEILSKVTASSDFLQIPTQEIKHRDLEQPGYRQLADMCHRKPVNQHHVPGGLPRSQSTKPGDPAHTQTRPGKKEKVEIFKGHRRLPPEQSVPVAGTPARLQASDLPKFLRLGRQQTWHLKYLHIQQFFRQQPGTLKRKTRRGGQCRRGLQKPHVDQITESLDCTTFTILGTVYTLHGPHVRPSTMLFHIASLEAYSVSHVCVSSICRVHFCYHGLYLHLARSTYCSG